MASESRVFFYAARGPDLGAFALDEGRVALTRSASVSLPAWVQYAWPHPRLAVLYVVSSDGGPASGRAGALHHATAWRIDPASGELTGLGAPVALPARPIHCTVEPGGGFLIAAYNQPSGVSVHRLGTDGALGAEVDQPASLDCGIYAHQARVTPSGRTLIVVARGNDPAGERPEDPGALCVFGLDGGRLSPRARVTPGEGGGFGFGPRHLDFHPSKPWVYVSVERQNQLQVYALDGEENLSSEPRFVVDALSAPADRHALQMAGTVRVHPSGCFAYQANRSGGLGRDPDGFRTARGGEDSLVVYALDPGTGEPRAVQHLELPAIHTRTIAVHPSGRLLAAATIEPVPVREPDGSIRLVPATIMLFRIGNDGRLTLARRYQVDTRGTVMWWTGLVSVPA